MQRCCYGVYGVIIIIIIVIIIISIIIIVIIIIIIIISPPAIFSVSLEHDAWRPKEIIAVLAF